MLAQKNKPLVKVELAQYRVSVLDLAEKIVTQNRKHNCFCLLTGQSLPANVLPTLTRDNLSSRLVFNSSDMHARMAGLDLVPHRARGSFRAVVGRNHSGRRLRVLIAGAQPATEGYYYAANQPRGGERDRSAARGNGAREPETLIR